jgi:DNA mismatch repair protein MutL
MNEELYVIDQHAAHERVMFEKFKNEKNEGKQLSQVLLTPEVIELKHGEMELVKKNNEFLSELGFEVDEFGSNAIKVNAVPYICVDSNVREVMLDVIDGLNEFLRGERKTQEDKILYQVACKAAVKANSELSREEIYALIESMNNLENPYTCPHGRPTAIKMTKYEIEKKFGRT